MEKLGFLWATNVWEKIYGDGIDFSQIKFCLY